MFISLSASWLGRKVASCLMLLLPWFPCHEAPLAQSMSQSKPLLPPFPFVRYFVTMKTISNTDIIYKTVSLTISILLAAAGHCVSGIGILGGVAVFTRWLWSVSLQRVQQCVYESPSGIRNNQQEDSGQVILKSVCLNSAICPDTSKTMTQGARDLYTWLPWPTLGFLEKFHDLCFFFYS